MGGLLRETRQGSRGVHKSEVEVGGLRGRSLGQITNVRDEVGGRGEGGIFPGQPDLV